MVHVSKYTTHGSYWLAFFEVQKTQLQTNDEIPVHDEDLLTCKIIRDTTAHQAIVAYLGYSDVVQEEFFFLKQLMLSEEHSNHFFFNGMVSPAYLHFFNFRRFRENITKTNYLVLLTHTSTILHKISSG